MFCDVWKYAGNLRQEDLNIGCKWQNVQTELYKLEGDIAYWHEHISSNQPQSDSPKRFHSARSANAEHDRHYFGKPVQSQISYNQGCTQGLVAE